MGWVLRRRPWLIAVPIALLLLIPAVLLAAQRPGAAASTVLTVFSGGVSVSSGAATFAEAHDGDLLRNGDSVRTDGAGHALVTFFDGSTLELEPSTLLTIDTASSSPDGSKTIGLTQTLGRTWASVQKLTHADSRFEIRTPTSTAAVRGTGFFTEVLASGETNVQTTDGTVAVTAQGQTVLVTAGLSTNVLPNAAPTTPAPSAPARNRIRFGMHSPAYLAVIDPLGRTCGIVMPSATVVRHIPGCVASEPGSEPQIVEVPDAKAGTYRTLIAAIDPGGTFTLTATGLDASDGVVFDLSLAGNGVAGAVFGSSLEVQAGPDGRLTASSLGALVTLQGPSPSPSPTEAPTDAPTDAPTAAPTGTPATSFVPIFQLPTLPTVSPTPTPSPAPTATPSPSPSPTPTPSATLDPSTAPTASPSPAATTPVPGCTPSTNQPRKCTSSAGK